jgi:hypothetical protein
MRVSFNVPAEVMTAIELVAERYQTMLKRFGMPSVDQMSLIMDLTATHANGCPIDWDRLNKADDFTLAHDVGGIQRHINRQSGQLEDCFLPRCAVPKAEREYDGSYVEDHCPECGQYDSECTCVDHERELADKANEFRSVEH